MTLIEHLTDSTLASFATTPVTAEELARFNAFNRVNAATSLQLHFARADTLAHDEVFAGDPSSYAAQTNAALTLTPADVQAAARRYLTAWARRDESRTGRQARSDQQAESSVHERDAAKWVAAPGVRP